MNDRDTNSLIWRMFMSATMDAADHLGKDYLENFRSTINQVLRTTRQLFDVSQKLITDQAEIHGISNTGWYTPWQRTTLLCDKAVQPSTAKVYVFSDSVVSWHNESTSRGHRRMEKEDRVVYRVPVNIVNWIESTESHWNSSGQFSQDSQHHRFSLRF